MAITPKAPGEIQPPNDLTANAVVDVGLPNTLPVEAVTPVAVPNTLPAEAVVNVAIPNELVPTGFELFQTSAGENFQVVGGFNFYVEK